MGPPLYPAQFLRFVTLALSLALTSEALTLPTGRSNFDVVVVSARPRRPLGMMI